MKKELKYKKFIQMLSFKFCRSPSIKDAFKLKIYPYNVGPLIINIDVIIFIQMDRKLGVSRTRSFQMLKGHPESSPLDSFYK